MNTSLFIGIYQGLLRAWPFRWLGFFLALIATSIVGLVVISLPDQYESKAKVFINADLILKPLLEGLAVEDDTEGRVRILRILQTTLVNERNISRLIDTPGMGFDVSTPGARSRASSTIKSGVIITEESENLFALTYVDTNAIRSRNVASGLLSLFIETTVTQTRGELQSARAFLDKQIAEHEAQLRALEMKIAQFQSENVDALGEQSYQVRVRAARTVVSDARLVLQLAVQTRDRIQAQASGGSRVLVAGDATLPALIDRINALRAQLNTLLLQYTEKHPDVVATRREIALLSEQYGLSEDAGAQVVQPFQPGTATPASAVNTAVGGAATAGPTSATPAAQQAGVNEGKLQMLLATFAVMDAERKLQGAQAALQIIEQQGGTAPTAEADLDRLNRDYAVVKENYETLLRRRASASMANAADVSQGSEQFRIVQAPNVPKGPTGPDREAYLLIGALLAVAAGAAMAYALGLLRGAFVSAAEAESALGLPVIAHLTNRTGALSRVSKSADTLTLLAAVAGIFVAAYILSGSTELLSPVRAQIYQLLEANLGAIGSLF